ncbi:MAG: LysM peptidoglycan-binding domain-containing protein [Chloroflexi bacterium]|nr:MAG: LysM peptidoglycan-binding domain-containing protein [Chloroflexota bacterium]
MAVIAFAISLALGTPAPAPNALTAPTSHLPATQPGSGPNEGVFLVTTADDGGRATYFIAGNARHSILAADMQLELQLNPLWPVHTVSPDDALALAEGAPVGNARQGLVGGTAAEPEPVAEAPAPDASPTAASATNDVADEAPAPTQSTYVLRPGDNLTRVAAQHGTTVAAILAANGLLNANRIYVGQTLVMPGETANPEVVETPATPARVAADDEQPVADAPDGPAAATYTVKRGDTAFLIARHFGVTQSELLAANGIANANRVYVGQVLAIPAS